MALDIILRDALDRDALDYCARSGASDKAAISAFVRGVKALGLWNNMVCWPLRSSQNAGNGDTVYSLGGLGTFNGTRVNGPAWTADGLSFPETTPVPHVLTAFTPSVSENFNVFAAFQCNPVGSALNCICASRQSSPSILFFSFFQSSESWERAVLWTTTGAIMAQGGHRTDGSYNTASARFEIAGSTKLSGLTRNNNSEVTASATDTIVPAAAPLVLGAETTTQRPLSGNLPFVAYLKVSSFNNAAFRTLYKSTLGTGLGLP